MVDRMSLGQFFLGYWVLPCQSLSHHLWNVHYSLLFTFGLHVFTFISLHPSQFGKTRNIRNNISDFRNEWWECVERMKKIFSPKRGLDLLDDLWKGVSNGNWIGQWARCFKFHCSPHELLLVHGTLITHLTQLRIHFNSCCLAHRSWYESRRKKWTH